jgi:hypothetical protein
MPNYLSRDSDLLVFSAFAVIVMRSYHRFLRGLRGCPVVCSRTVVSTALAGASFSLVAESEALIVRAEFFVAGERG